MSAQTQFSPLPPLRILCLLNLDWNRHLGAARVYMELYDQWRASGHSVEHFSFSEAYPAKDVTPREYGVRRWQFPGKAEQFVRENAAQFDVIDALTGSLSSSKARLGFKGLLVARSVGSHQLYHRFEKSVHKRWPDVSRGTLLGRLFHSRINRRFITVSDAGLVHADLINVPNTEEADFLRSESHMERRVLVQPYGLTDENAAALRHSAGRTADKLRSHRISFIGMWAPRKGARIWGDIIKRVRRKLPNTQFRFLGTMVPPEAVYKDLGVDSTAGIETVPEFAPDELPKLLADCSVGAFPSFVEGFGLAVIEQLAAGVPTVAFDQGGPRDILRDMPELLVPPDDVKGFADRLVKTMQLPFSEYERLVQTGLQTVARYSWWQIAKDTLAAYRNALGKP